MVLTPFEPILLGFIAGILGATAEWVLLRKLALNAIAVGWLLTLRGWFISARLSEREQDWVAGLQQLGFTLHGRLQNRKMFPHPPQEEEMFWYRKTRTWQSPLW